MIEVELKLCKSKVSWLQFRFQRSGFREQGSGGRVEGSWVDGLKFAGSLSDGLADNS